MKSAYQEYQALREADRDLPEWNETRQDVPRPPALARNPFAEFQNIADASGKEIPLDRILADHDEAVARLIEGYKHLVSDEAEDGLFQPDGDTIARIYRSAVDIVGNIPCQAGDIEAFCLRAMQSDDPDFFLMGPLGLYISALCNASDAREIGLNLAGPEMRLPLLGYRLQEGKVLSIEGDLNDLIGISLEGGHLKVTGNVGRYLGAGMAAGRIDVSGDAGRFIGEQMAGGEIHVHGRIGGLGKPRGGEVYHRKRRVYPQKEKA